jgi:hypothetical protein
MAGMRSFDSTSGGWAAAAVAVGGERRAGARTRAARPAVPWRGVRVGSASLVSSAVIPQGYFGRREPASAKTPIGRL